MPIEVPTMDQDELKRASYILIRHAYSEFNYAHKMVENFGERSKEDLAVRSDPRLMDPSLHAIGVEQCNMN